jgi:carbonic anhydrase
LGERVSVARLGVVDRLLAPVNRAGDILPAYRGTAIGDLLMYHELHEPHRRYVDPELLIGMCMDHRLTLRIPANFAFVLRCAGANVSMLSFDISFAIAIGGVRAMCVIGHSGCRMVDVASRREAFVGGLVAAVGWDRAKAEKHFDELYGEYGFCNVVDFVIREARHLRSIYPGILVAPLVYAVEDRRLHQIDDTQ